MLSVGTGDIEHSGNGFGEYFLGVRIYRIRWWCLGCHRQRVEVWVVLMKMCESLVFVKARVTFRARGPDMRLRLNLVLNECMRAAIEKLQDFSSSLYYTVFVLFFYTGLTF